MKRGHDPYGITVYEGERTDGRYIVWRGWFKGQMEGQRPYHHSLKAAIKEARRLQARGYDVKVTDLGDEVTP